MEFDVRQVQTWLKSLGYDPGPIDGIRGPRTDAAIVAFKRTRGLRPRAYVGTVTLAALEQAMADRTRFAGDPAGLPWIELAGRMLGLHEQRDNAELRKFLASDGHALGDPARFPWCGDFIETCIRLTLPDEPFPGALGQNPYWALNWRFLGVETPPTFGAVGSIERDGGGHVFFLIGEDATAWYGLGGNQGDSVTRARIPKSTPLAGCRWPATFPQLPVVLPQLTPGDLKLSPSFS